MTYHMLNNNNNNNNIKIDVSCVLVMFLYSSKIII
jgi:hypothetical protein